MGRWITNFRVRLHVSFLPPFQTSLITYSLLLLFPHLNIGTTSFGLNRKQQSYVVRLCSHRLRKQEHTHSPPLPPSLLPSSPQELSPSDLIENKVLLDAFAVIAQGNKNGGDLLFESAVDLLIDVFVAHDWYVKQALPPSLPPSLLPSLPLLLSLPKGIRMEEIFESSPLWIC